MPLSRDHFGLKIFLLELCKRHNSATAKLLHVGKVGVARDEDVGIGHAGQFQKIVVLRVTATLRDVAERIVLAAGTEEGKQAVAGFGGEVAGELGSRGHGHDFLLQDVGHDDDHRAVGQDAAYC